MTVYRYHDNPIISPEQVKPSRSDFQVICVINGGTICCGDETIMLVRVAEKPIAPNEEQVLYTFYDTTEDVIRTCSLSRDDDKYDFSDSRVVRAKDETYLTSISHLRVARSIDGVHFTVSDTEGLYPSNEYEMYGVEDPRITQIGQEYYITYSAVSPLGITCCLAKTKDFQEFQKLGPIFLPDNKDVVLYPEKINGYYYAINRPTSGFFRRNDMWIARSNDLLHWGDNRFLMGGSQNDWEQNRVGAGSVPIKTDAGWLLIYHGASNQSVYSLGAALFDLEDPTKLIARTEKPIMQPQEKYEREGFFPNVVFNCGTVCKGDTLRIYYNAADTCMCYAEMSCSEVLKLLKA